MGHLRNAPQKEGINVPFSDRNSIYPFKTRLIHSSLVDCFWLTFMEATWHLLPRDVVFLTLTFLPVTDVGHLALVSCWFCLVTRENQLWRMLFRRDYPLHYPNRDFKDYRFQYSKKMFTDLRQQVYRQWNNNHQIRLNTLMDQRKPLSRQINELNKRKQKVMRFEKRFHHVRQQISSNHVDHVKHHTKL